MRFLLPLGIFALLVIVLGIGLTLDPKLVPSPLIGKAAPDFALSELDDEQRVVSKSDLLGKPLLLNVWASWCIECRNEHPLLVDLAAQNIVAVVGLNYKDERQVARDWLKQRGNPYVLTLFDPDGKLGLDLGVYGVPESFLIDGAGIIRYKHIGPLNNEVVTRDLLPMIKQLTAN
jgi:cytochrome c biogenesis protein CcmG, thiol:disulfide interchange protein DsbE